MRVLVTGASGFIGWKLLRRILKETDWNIDFVTRKDLIAVKEENASRCNHVFLDLSDEHAEGWKWLDKYDLIFHLAATPTVKPNFNNPNEIIHNNVIATNNLLHRCTKDGTRFIFASSVLVYGNCWGYMNESMTCQPTSLYGASKLASEGLITAFQSYRDISYMNLRLCATVGTGLTHGLLYDLVAKLRSDNPQLELLGDAPGSSKPYMHVDDVVDAMVTTAKWKDSFTVNLGHNDHVCVAEIAEQAMQILDIRKPVKWLGEGANWKGDNRIVRMNAFGLLELGWEPKCKSSLESIKKALKEHGNT